MPTRRDEDDRPAPRRPSLTALFTVAALTALLALTACGDGYPGEDAPLISPFDMDNGQRLAALNEIGRSAHPQQQWRFSLAESCRLTVTQQRKGSREAQRSLPLARSMDARVSFDKADRTYGVTLVAWADGAADPQPLLTTIKSPGWTDARSAEQLLQLLIRDCGESDRRAD